MLQMRLTSTICFSFMSREEYQDKKDHPCTSKKIPMKSYPLIKKTYRTIPAAEHAIIN